MFLPQEYFCYGILRRKDSGPRGLVEALGLFAFPRRIGADELSVAVCFFLVNP
jgi:hypothetical protein